MLSNGDSVLSVSRMTELPSLRETTATLWNTIFSAFTHELGLSGLTRHAYPRVTKIDYDTAPAAPVLPSRTLVLHHFLVKKTPRYLNSFTWGKDVSPTCSRRSMCFLLRTMASDLEALILIPPPLCLYDPIISKKQWGGLRVTGL